MGSRNSWAISAQRPRRRNSGTTRGIQDCTCASVSVGTSTPSHHSSVRSASPTISLSTIQSSRRLEAGLVGARAGAGLGRIAHLFEVRLRGRITPTQLPHLGGHERHPNPDHAGRFMMQVAPQPVVFGQRLGRSARCSTDCQRVWRGPSLPTLGLHPGPGTFAPKMPRMPLRWGYLDDSWPSSLARPALKLCAVVFHGQIRQCVRSVL